MKDKDDHSPDSHQSRHDSSNQKRPSCFTVWFFLSIWVALEEGMFVCLFVCLLIPCSYYTGRTIFFIKQFEPNVRKLHGTFGASAPGPQLSLQMKSENHPIPSLPCFPRCQTIHLFVSKAIRNIFQSSNTDPPRKEAMPVSWIPDLTSANRRWLPTLYFKEIIISLPMIYFTQRDLPGIVK